MEIVPTVESLEFCRAQATAEEAGELEEGEVVPIGDYLREDIPEGVRSTYARALPNLLREGAGGGIFPESGAPTRAASSRSKARGEGVPPIRARTLCQV